MSHICEFYGRGCNTKRHRSEETARKHHDRIGLIRNSSINNPGRAHNDVKSEISVSQSYTLEQQELIEDFRDAYSDYIDKNKNAKKEVKELRQQANTLRFDLENYIPDNSLPYLEQMKQKAKHTEAQYEKINELEKRANKVKIDAKFSDVLPDIDLTELSDEEFQLAVDTLSKIYQDEIKKPIPYEDPFPDNPGKHIVFIDCDRCGGTGRYDGHGGDDFIAEVRNRDGSYSLAKACYKCEGAGKTKTTTTMIRAEKKKQANRDLKEYQEALDGTEKRAKGKLQRQKALQLQAKDVHIVNPIAEERKATLKNIQQEFPVGEKTSPQNVTVTKVRKFTSRYGGRLQEQKAITFDSGKGYNFVWITGSKNNLEQGKEYSITGNIKKVEQNDYDSSLQVVMNRVKVEEL